MASPTGISNLSGTSLFRTSLLHWQRVFEWLSITFRVRESRQLRASENSLTGNSVTLKICVRNTRGDLQVSDLGKKPPIMRIVGIVLICIGLLTLALPYITFTKQEKVLDIGPIEAVAEKKERIPVSPIIGAIILLAGAGIVIASARKGSL
jgi:hypothetical protein